MSQFIDAGLVKAYRANIAMAVQQKMSRLRGAVTVESAPNAEFSFFDRVGTTAAQKRTGRNVPVAYTDTPHDRRRVGMSEYYTADLIDKKDKLRMIADPTSVYVRTFVAGMNRAIDDALIGAAFDTVYTGKEGTTTLTFAQDNGVSLLVDTNEALGSGGTPTGLNTLKLRKAKMKLAQAETGIDDGDLIYLLCPPLGVEQLLREGSSSTAGPASGDYNAVKALVNGEIDTWMGFKFIMTNRLPISSNVSNCIAFTKDALLLAIGQDIESSVDVLPQMHFSTQVYSSMTIGAVRMWGEKVIKIPIATNV